MTGEELRQAIIGAYGNRGISAFARDIGASRATVERWITGKTPVPVWAGKVIAYTVLMDSQPNG